MQQQQNKQNGSGGASGSGGPPPPAAAAAPAHDGSDEPEAFIGAEGVEGFEGEVLDDLDGDGMAPDDLSSDDEDDSAGIAGPVGGAGAADGGEGDAEGPAAGPSGGDQPMEDDSLQAFEGHRDAVLAVAWCGAQPDLVATGGQDDRAYMWRVGHDAAEATGGTMATTELPGHTDSVVAAAFNAGGSLLATASLDATVRVWRVPGGECVRALEGPGDGVEWLAWHPKGDVLLAGSEDFTMWMWLAQSGHCMQVFTGHSGPVAAGCFTPDGRAVVSAGGEGDASLRVWDPKTGACTATISGHPFHDDALTCLALHGDGAVALTGAVDGSLRVSNVNTARVVAALQGHHDDSVEAVGFSRQLPLAASAGIDGKLVVWDCGTFTERGVCEHGQPVTRMAWAQQAPLVATGCVDGVVRLWDLRTARCVRQLHGHAAAVQDLAFSADGAMLLSGADDATARVFAVGDALAAAV